MLLDVLLVEDNPGDVRLIRDTLCGANKAVRLHVVADGIDAIAFLRQEGLYDAVPCPNLILLALSLPKLDGRELLARIKADENLKTIPIIILASSDEEDDIMNCYQLRANCYLSKPKAVDEFENMLRSVNDFWLTKVKFITRSRD